MSSPLCFGERIYIHLRNQRLTCFDWQKGESLWTSSERYGKYMSMVGQQDRILALDQRGILILFAVRPDRLDVIDTRQISEDTTWAHLAVSGNDLFVRELGALTVFAWREPPRSEAELELRATVRNGN